MDLVKQKFEWHHNNNYFVNKLSNEFVWLTKKFEQKKFFFSSSKLIINNKNTNLSIENLFVHIHLIFLFVRGSVFFLLIIIIEVDNSRRKPTTSDNKKKKKEKKDQVCMCLQMMLFKRRAIEQDNNNKKKERKNCIHTLTLLKSLERNARAWWRIKKKNAYVRKGQDI